MEERLGHDFSKIRVHTDAWAAQAAQEANAEAYTVGRDLVFGAGQYRPETASGRQLLAHELTHSVQQGLSGHSQPRSTLEQEATAAAELIRTERPISIVNKASTGVAQHQLRARGTRYPGDPQKDNIWWNLMQTPEAWPNFAQHPQFQEILFENPAVLELLDRLPEFRSWKRGGPLPGRFTSAPEAPKEPQKSSRERFMESFLRASTLKQKGEAALRVDLPEFYGYYERLADQAANETKEMLTFLIPVVGALGWDLAEFAAGETTSGRPVDRLQKSIGILWQLANIGMLFLGPEAKIPEGVTTPEIPVARKPLIELPGGGTRFDPRQGNIIVGDLPPVMTPKPTTPPSIGVPTTGPGGGSVVLEPVATRTAAGQVTVGTTPRVLPKIAPVMPAPAGRPPPRTLDIAVGLELPTAPGRPVAAAPPAASGAGPGVSFPGVPVVHPLEAPGPERAPVKREAPAPKSDVPVHIEAPPPPSEVPRDVKLPSVKAPEGGEHEPLQLAGKTKAPKASDIGPTGQTPSPVGPADALAEQAAKQGVMLDRKLLQDLAVKDPEKFSRIARVIRQRLAERAGRLGGEEAGQVAADLAEAGKVGARPGATPAELTYIPKQKSQVKLSHDAGVEGGRARATNDGIKVRDWNNPESYIGDYGRGFDDVGDRGQELIVLEWKAEGSELAPGQMSSRWVGKRIANLDYLNDPLAKDLLTAAKSGKLSGRVYRTTIGPKGELKTVLETKIQFDKQALLDAYDKQATALSKGGSI